MEDSLELDASVDSSRIVDLPGGKPTSQRITERPADGVTFTRAGRLYEDLEGSRARALVSGLYGVVLALRHRTPRSA